MLKCGIKKRVHRLTGRSGKGNVKTLARNSNRLGPQLDRKLITAANQTVSNGDLILLDATISQRSKHGIIEGTRTCQISNGKRQVVKHVMFNWANDSERCDIACQRQPEGQHQRVLATDADTTDSLRGLHPFCSPWLVWSALLWQDWSNKGGKRCSELLRDRLTRCHRPKVVQ